MGSVDLLNERSIKIGTFPAGSVVKRLDTEEGWRVSGACPNGSTKIISAHIGPAGLVVTTDILPPARIRPAIIGVVPRSPEE